MCGDLAGKARPGSAMLGTARQGPAWRGRLGVAWQAWYGLAGRGKAWHGAAGQAWRGVAGQGAAWLGTAGRGRHGTYFSFTKG